MNSFSCHFLELGVGDVPRVGQTGPVVELSAHRPAPDSSAGAPSRPEGQNSGLEAQRGLAAGVGVQGRGGWWWWWFCLQEALDWLAQDMIPGLLP